MATCIAIVALAAQGGQSWADMPSFPGAEGYGASAKGGRGGRVIKVTHLRSEGPGSLQAACAAEGPRIIVFEVAGIIRGDVAIKSPYITIAGQTAPSPGITIEGRLLARPEHDERLHDVVVRHLRVRPRPASGHAGDAIQLPKSDRVILDHVSLSWANDETIDIIHSSNVTVQWSTLEESDPVGHDKGIPHNYGLLSAYPGSGNVTIHHNLFAHQSRRNPSISPSDPAMTGDFRNNVVYNFRDGLSHEGHIPKGGINLVGNYYKRGPDAMDIWPFRLVNEGRYYIRGNYFEDIGVVNIPLAAGKEVPKWLHLPDVGMLMEKQFPTSRVQTEPAGTAYRNVLARAGCFPRDRITTRTIAEVTAGTGRWERRGPSEPSDEWYVEGLKRETSSRDSDDDGIPDSWEQSHGLDKENPHDNITTMSSGYSAIEEYINELAARKVQQETSRQR